MNTQRNPLDASRLTRQEMPVLSPQAAVHVARKRAARCQATGKRSDQPARLVEGQRVMGWREALNELETAYPQRLR